ncbi:MAG: VOC family protein, partial [Dehalococcoidia bacterium]|nr:VOC family protein [Dehalococcoidia bacterium]
MITRIDHLVIVVTDLDRAIDAYQALGFTVVPGGQHRAGLTKNALIGFPDGAYLELVTYIDFANAPGHRWYWTYQRGGGLEDLCLGSTDLASDVAALNAAGVAYSPPRVMGRTRPDGHQVEWRLSHAPSDAVYLPFLLEDITPRDLRVPSGADARHANGVLGVQ